MFDSELDWQNITAALGFSVVVAVLAAQIVARFARLVLAKTSMPDEPAAFTSPIVRKPIRITRAIVLLLTLLVVTPPALEVAGVTLAFGLDVETVTRWFFESGLRITMIAVLAYFANRILALIVQRFEAVLSRREGTDLDKLEMSKRARTLGGLIQNTLTIVVVSVALLMILRELQVDIMPVLTGAGVVGLAVGFGAQTLVRDIIAGFFLILENQARVGDVAIINGTGGFVEAINLRTIVLRDLSGTVHVFPNGVVERLSNMTRDFSYYVVDVGVAYKEDTDEVVSILREVGAGLMADPAFGPNILAPLEILGVDAFEDSQVTVKIRIKTVPIKQWEVGRELRRRIKKTFDERGIEIPFPHMSIYFGEASKPWAVQQAGSRA